MSTETRTTKVPRAAFGAAGQIVGKFRLGTLIGAGGFGEVWKAQEEIEGRPVGDACAVKLLRVTHGDTRRTGGSDGRRAAWVQEINALKSVEIPAIPRTIDGGIDEASGLAFIAMQLLEGDTLGKRIAERRLGWRRALAIAASVAVALDTAHARKLVHRDLKPQNVFLDKSGRVYVIDWGIAALAGGSASVAGAAEGGVVLRREVTGETATSSGDASIATAELSVGEQMDAVARFDARPRELTGTHGYIAPECYGGAEPTAAADAYALGVVLHQAIAGRLPYRVAALPSGSGATDAFRARTAELMKATIEGSIAPLEEVAPGVPEGVRRLVATLLSLDPSARVNGPLADAVARASRFPYGLPDPPYAGLESFGAERAALLFGREAHVRQIVRRLENERAIVLSGPSGCGKSSLAVAGVATELDRSLAGGTDGWRLEVVRPSETSVLAIAGAGARSEVGRGAAAEPLLGTVVVVDQLEEVLALDGAARDTFSAALAALAEGTEDVTVRGRVVQAGAPARVIATVREDSEWQVVKIESLRALCETHRCLVTGVDATAAREMVEEPARALGYRVEGAGDVVAEAEKTLAGDPTKLPIVEFALSEWWARRDGEKCVLPAAAWQEIGGIDGALSHVADRFYRSLEEKDQKALGELFRLFVRNERKRPVPLASLDGEAPRRMCEELVKLRLVRRHEERDGRIWFELAHESLGKRWDVLRRWIADAAAEDALIADLEDEARLWVRHGRAAGRLRGDAQAVKAAVGVRARLEGEAQAYVDACVVAERAAGAAEKKKRTRRNGTIAGVVAVVLAAISAYAVTITGEQAKTKEALGEVEKKKEEVDKERKEALAAADRASRAEKVADDKRKEAEEARGEQEKLKTKFQDDLGDLEKKIADARGDAARLKRIAGEVAAKRDGGLEEEKKKQKLGGSGVRSRLGDPP